MIFGPCKVDNKLLLLISESGLVGKETYNSADDYMMKTHLIIFPALRKKKTAIIESCMSQQVMASFAVLYFGLI